MYVLTLHVFLVRTFYVFPTLQPSCSFGLALTTVITHGGLYPLVLIAFASGLGNGEWILVLFWVGRAVTLWLAPWLSGRSTDGVAVFEALSQAVPSFQATATCGLAILCSMCVAVSVVLLGVAG